MRPQILGGIRGRLRGFMLYKSRRARINNQCEGVDFIDSDTLDTELFSSSSPRFNTDGLNLSIVLSSLDLSRYPLHRWTGRYLLSLKLFLSATLGLFSTGTFFITLSSPGTPWRTSAQGNCLEKSLPAPPRFESAFLSAWLCPAMRGVRWPIPVIELPPDVLALDLGLHPGLVNTPRGRQITHLSKFGIWLIKL